jgi:uncharacterized delta-60 repeat protein
MKTPPRFKPLLRPFLPLALLFIQVISTLIAAPGDLDALDANPSNYVTTSAVQPDGKIIIAGNFTTVLGVARNYIARLNADGTLDMAFDPRPNGTVYCVGVQADGKIVLGGSFSSLWPSGTASSTSRSNLARLNPNGSLDMSFDPSPEFSVYCLAVQADGKILLGGEFTRFRPNGGTALTLRSFLARLNADGTLDMGFDPSPNYLVYCVLPQADGRVLIGGLFTALKPNGATTSTTRQRIARIHADGTLDLGFAPNADSELNSIAVQADGKILIGGFFNSFPPIGFPPPISRPNLARLNVDGTLDSSFIVEPNSTVQTIAVQADGNILAGGNFTSIKTNGVQTTSRNYIARLRGDGFVDSGFDPKADARVLSIMMQENGKILLGGRFTTLQPNGAASPTSRPYLASLSNSAAEQGLRALDANQILWTRKGSAPEAHAVSFEQSSDGGLTWTLLGSATRVGTTADWQLTELSLPTSGLLRASAAVHSGAGTSLLRTKANYHLTAAPSLTGISPASGHMDGGTTVTITGTDLESATEVLIGGVAAKDVVRVNATTITATTPTGRPGAVDVNVITAGGTSSGVGIYTYVAPAPLVSLTNPTVWANVPTLTITGANFSPTPGDNVVTFSPAGTGTVINATPGTLTVSGIMGLVPGALSAVVTSFGLSSGAPVQVAQVVPVPAGNLDSLDAQLRLTNGNPSIKATAVQPDGKTIIGGKFNAMLGVARNHLARLNADGTLDLGFDPKPNLNSSSFAAISCFAVQADGKILVGGDFSSFQPNGAPSSTARNGIARLNADGSLDEGFNPKMYSSGSVNAIALQADGMILLGGDFTMVEGDLGYMRYSSIVRLHTDGSLDRTFQPNAFSPRVESVVVQPDGKILVGGFLGTFRPNDVGPQIVRYFLARLNADGSVDVGFDPDRSISPDCIALQTDGKILVSGTLASMSINGAPYVTATRYMGRLNADGTLDASFDPKPNSSVESIAVQADGRTLLGGSFSTLQPNGAATATTRWSVARLNANGTLDMGFDPKPFGGRVESIAQQADGKILLGGGFSSLRPNGALTSTERLGFARLYNDSGTQTLTAPNTDRIIWTRRGALPEVSQVTFELSTDHGSSWQMLGRGSRIGTTADWQLTGLSLPTSGLIRARGRTTGGRSNGSSGLVEQVAALGSYFGTLSFASQVFAVASGPTATTADIVIQRKGGTLGSAGCSFNSIHGSATSPVHYTQQSNVLVSYADGNGGDQHFSIPIAANAATTTVRTFQVALTSPSADTDLATPSTATVAILPPAAYTETTKPTVSITTPASNALIPDAPVLTITGTAKDNLGVRQVQVSLDGGTTFAEATLSAPAATSTGYSFAMTPVTGSNAIQVRSIDFKGNASDWVRRSFTQLRTLKVRNNSQVTSGKLTAGFSPTSSRQVGKAYTITATPTPGNVFNGWKVNNMTGTGITPAATELPALAFIFTEGLELTASFIANPFWPHVGTYNGLMLPDQMTPRSVANVGLLNLVVGTFGTFTGSLKIDGTSLSVPGFFDNAGVARFGTTRARSLALKRPGKPDHIIALQLDMASSSRRITGSVTQKLLDAAQGVSTVTADRAHYSSTNKVPATLAGTASKPYTLVLPAKDQTPALPTNTYPQGTGYATMTVGTIGTVSITGKLADNTPITASAPLSKLNQWPLFASLYLGKGCFAGLATLADADASTADVTGTDLCWIRPALTKVQWYPAGWPTGIVVDLSGARYVVPPATPATSVFPGLGAVDALAGNARLTFTGGLLGTSPLNFGMNISPTNAATNVPVSALPTLTITRTSGLISGSFPHSDATKPTFQGVIVQKGTHQGASGYFMSTSPKIISGLGESGVVKVQAVSTE